MQECCGKKGRAYIQVGRLEVAKVLQNRVPKVSQHASCEVPAHICFRITAKKLIKILISQLPAPPKLRSLTYRLQVKLKQAKEGLKRQRKRG